MNILGQTKRPDKVDNGNESLTTSSFDIALNQTVAQLQLFLLCGQVTELRALGVESPQIRRVHVVSGYYDDLEKLARSALEVSQYARGVYYIPNPINSDLMARCYNRCRPVFGEKLTSDADIQERRTLLIDIDANRPSGISSTEAELGMAITRAKDVVEWLTIQGWPDPVVILSGNGIHLAYPIDLPVNDGGVIERILRSLALRFDDDLAVVDPKTHKPAQLHKIPGTWVRKGDNRPDRPHRMAQILYVPEKRVLVPQPLLDRVAAMAPAPQRAQSLEPGRGTFDLAKWIIDHSLDVVGPREWQGGHRWIFRVCPWDSEHTNQSAYIVQLPTGAIAAGCHHASCADKTWHDLRDLVEPGWRERRSGGISLSLPPSIHPAIRRQFQKAAEARNGRSGT